jgi:hypothetical protein
MLVSSDLKVGLGKVDHLPGSHPVYPRSPLAATKSMDWIGWFQVDFQVHEYIREIIEMPPRGCGSWLKAHNITKLRPASGCVSWKDFTAAASSY